MIDTTDGNDIPLPEAVAGYFAAANEKRAGVAASCFTEDGVVEDEGHEHAGRTAIRDWVAAACARYHPRAKVVEHRRDGATEVVTALVTGTFPGSPVELEYRFELADGAISRLAIQ